MKSTAALFLISILFYSLFITSAPNAVAQSSSVTFAAIGDYGTGDEYADAVATMISGWSPDLVLGLGDSYYVDAGGTGDQKYDLAVGKFYCNFLKDITTTTGTFCPTGQAPYNRFFPALGDHDYTDAGTTNGLPTTYTDYFSLPGSGYTSSSNNERYYDFVYGPIHFFILNSYDGAGGEPDGIDSDSVQAQWLRTGLGSSTSTWNVVVVPSPPYSSGEIHGSTSQLQWPYAEWGADAVLSGDDHVYERILKDGIVYLVDGLGGAWPYAFRHPPVDGSAYRFTGINGALRVNASETSMTFEFYSVENGGTLKDTYTLTVPHNTPTPTLPPNSTGWQSPTKQAAATSNAGDNNGYEINPTYTFADDSFAAMDMDSGTTTSLSCTDSGKDKHRFYNYNLSVPAGAIVQGVQVRLDASADSISGDPKLCSSLSWDGGLSWTSWKTTSTLTDSQETYLLGGASDMWGHAWSTSELSNSNFQVRIADIASDNSRDFSLDWIAVNIVYGLGSTSTPTLTATFTATLTSTSTLPQTDTHTPTATATPSQTQTPTNTPSSTPTVTNTSTSTATATATPTQTQTPTPTNTPTEPSLSTATPTATNTATSTATATQTPTATNTSTATSAPTATQVPTATATPSPAGTQTSTNTPTSTPTATNTSTSQPTATSTPTSTLTLTSTPQGSYDLDTTGVFRPSNGLLYLKNSNNTGFADVAINYGIPGDYPVVGDWDGNGTATIGVYRNGKFYLRNSNTLGFADMVFVFGTHGDQPIAGDWDGDDVDTIGVFRPSTGQFLLRNSNTAGAVELSFVLGNPGDVGIAGDWNGDGVDTTGVFRPINGIIFLKNTNRSGFADIALNYGIPGDKPVTGDWNNDGIDTIGVYRNGQFLLRNSNTIGFADIAFRLGNPGDMPIAGNWDAKP